MKEKFDNVCIRPVSLADASSLLAIYAPYVTDTAISFEEEVPSLAEFEGRIENICKKYPYLILCQGEGEKEEILGYAYASPFIHRAAYDHSVELSIYLKQGVRGMGLGRMLYQRIEEALRSMGVCNANACIAYPFGEDPYLGMDSVLFHRKMGFRMVGRFHRSGYKFGRWYDMVWMEKMIADHNKAPERIRVFHAEITGGRRRLDSEK